MGTGEGINEETVKQVWHTPATQEAGVVRERFRMTVQQAKALKAGDIFQEPESPLYYIVREVLTNGINYELYIRGVKPAYTEHSARRFFLRIGEQTTGNKLN
jgi:hypothetical protein